MTDNWDFFALLVEDKPASIFVDLGVQAPVQGLTHLAYLRLYMAQPRADGLSSQEEFDSLGAVEDALETQLCCERIGYVGRCTSDGCRDFYFYTSEPATWEQQVAAALVQFRTYEYETGTREDADWSTYANFLLPSEVDRQRIEDRRVCETLERNGDKLLAEREIDHWSFFRSDAAVEAFIAEVTPLGFHVRSTSKDESAPLPFRVQLWRLDVPSYARIHEITSPLLEAARRYDGEYDGWECAVIT